MVLAQSVPTKTNIFEMDLRVYGKQVSRLHFSAISFIEPMYSSPVSPEKATRYLLVR
jgi:hypothetical protein